MRSLALVVSIGIAGCYAPQPQPGSPCDELHPCPASLVCSASSATCVRDGDLLDGGGTADTLVEDCEPTGFEVCDDGVDQDCTGADAPCAENDAPDGAIDVTDGGTFTSDLLLATDHAPQVGCGGDGGRDVFYEVVLPAPEVVYVDTFGSDFDTTVRVFPGKACTAIGAATGPVCNDDACETGGSQLAAELPAGTSCIVVDQNVDATTGALELRVERGGRAGAKLAPTVTGDTCGATDRWNVSGCADLGGKDLGYWFLVCPGERARVIASTCASATSYTFDTVLYLRAPATANGTALACNDDDVSCVPRETRPDVPDGSKINALSAPGPGLGWLVLDAYDDRGCGPFTITSSVQ